MPISAPNRRRSSSAGQVITAGGALSVAHGLGVKPTRYFGVLICQTAELGFSIGQETPAQTTGADAAFHYGISIVPDSANLNVQFGNQAGVFLVNRFDTGNLSNITPANWLLVLRAEE